MLLTRFFQLVWIECFLSIKFRHFCYCWLFIVSDSFQEIWMSLWRDFCGKLYKQQSSFIFCFYYTFLQQINIKFAILNLFLIFTIKFVIIDFIIFPGISIQTEGFQQLAAYFISKKLLFIFFELFMTLNIIKHYFIFKFILRIPTEELPLVNITDEYDIEKTIAEGYFAKIFLAFHKPTKSSIVLKAW